MNPPVVLVVGVITNRSMTRIFPARSTIDAWCRNTMIVLLLGIMVLLGVPGIPDWLRNKVFPVGKALGLWQNTWTMFGPEPDSENNSLSARIRYRDGTVSDWTSPDWRTQSLTERALTHRLSKYLELIRSPDNVMAWPAFADYVVSIDQKSNGHKKEPAKVELRAHRSSIPDPRLGFWRPYSEPIRMDERWTIYEKAY